MCLKAELAFVKIDATDSRDCVPGLRELQWSSALAYNWWVRKIYAGLIVSRKESNRDLLVSLVHITLHFRSQSVTFKKSSPDLIVSLVRRFYSPEDPC